MRTIIVIFTDHKVPVSEIPIVQCIEQFSSRE